MFAGILVQRSLKHPQDFATPQSLLDWLMPYGQADKYGHWSNENALIVQTLTWNTAESTHESVPEVCQETGRVIVSWVRLDNRAELCTKLSLKNTPELTDPQIILAAHTSWDVDCANELEGDFSFVIHDPNRKTTYCARDSIGAKPFFYYVDTEVFIFASTAAVFPKIRNIDNSVSQEWLARYLVNRSFDRIKTAYSAVRKLPPAHYLLLENELLDAPKQYFQFQDTASFEITRNPQWVSWYRSLFDRVVGSRLRSDYPVGLETSGGIDSSSIVASAAKRFPESVSGFHLFGLVQQEHEPEYILETSIQYGITHNHILTSAPYFLSREVVLQGIRAIGYPSENALESYFHPFFKEARLHNIRTMLSGFGGDEFVTSHASKFLDELYVAGAWGTLLRELPGSLPMRIARFAKFVRQKSLANSGLKKRPVYMRDLLLNFVAPEARTNHGLDERVSARPDELSAASINSLALTYLNDDRFAGEITGRLEGFALTAQCYGISYRWPMLDRRLIQQFLDIPAIEKKAGSMGRYLHRRAFDGDVPDKVLWKPTKAMGSYPRQGRQKPYDINELLDNLPDELMALISEGAIIKLGESMNAHWRGDSALSEFDCAVGQLALKNLADLKWFMLELSPH